MHCRRLWATFVAPAISLLVFSALCISQTDPCRDRVVVVSVSQTGSYKQAVPTTNLTAENFRVSASGNPVVRTAEFHAQPGKAVLLLDVGQNPKADWKSQLAIASDLSASLSPDIELDLITFSDRVEQKFAFQKDRQSFLAALSQLAPVENRSSEGGLQAAVSEGFASPNRLQAGDVEIFLSAAPVTHLDKRARGRLEQLLALSGVRLFGVAFGEQSPAFTVNGQRVIGVMPAEPLFVEEHSEMFTSSEILAYYTGGVAFRFRGTLKSGEPPIRSLEAEALAAGISDFYVLALGISQPSKQPGQLQIKLRNNKLPGTIRLWHPIHLFPCPEQSAP